MRVQTPPAQIPGWPSLSPVPPASCLSYRWQPVHSPVAEQDSGIRKADCFLPAVSEGGRWEQHPPLPSTLACHSPPPRVNSEWWAAKASEQRPASPTCWDPKPWKEKHKGCVCWSNLIFQFIGYQNLGTGNLTLELKLLGAWFVAVTCGFTVHLAGSEAEAFVKARVESRLQ